MEYPRRGWLAVLLLCPAVAVAGTGPDVFGDRSTLRALAAHTGGQDAEALRHFRVALGIPRVGEQWMAVRFAAAQSALAAGEPKEALGFLEDMEGELPEVADFLLGTRARALRQLGDWSGARTAWQELLHRVPDSPLADEARYGIADALLAAEEWQEAHAAYRVALRAAPRAAQASAARFNAAFLDERAGRWDDAAAGYAAIAHRRPTAPLADVAAARLQELILDGRAPEATFSARLTRIDRLLAVSQVQAAEFELNELEFAATTPSRKVSVKLRRAEIAYRQGDHHMAADLYEELAQVSRGRRKRSYEMRVARCYAAAEQNDRAIAAYRAVSLRYPKGREGREALFKAAWLAYNSRDYSRAVQVFGEFVDRYPNDTSVDEALWYMAWNSFRLGDLPAALATLDRLRRDFPRSTLVQRSHYWQGRIYAQLGRGTEARASYRAAVAALPLDYYAMVAEQRLRELGAEPGGVAWQTGSTLVASAGSFAAGLPMSREGESSTKPLLASTTVRVDRLPGILESRGENRRPPAVSELPAGGDLLQPLSPFRLPWNGAVFDWHTAAGQRALSLIALGMRYHAADIVETLPAMPGQEADMVARARACLLYALGDFGTAYRLVLRRFHPEVRATPSPETLDLHRLAYPTAHYPLVQAAKREFDVSPLLLLAIMRQESGFQVRARSWANAQGLMQIIPPTGERIAAELGVEPFHADMLHIPEVNVRFGGWYIAQLLSKYGGHVALALANYNAGPGAAARWAEATRDEATDLFVEEIPYQETRHYVKRVLGNLWAYSVLYDSGALTLPERVPTTWAEEPSF